MRHHLLAAALLTLLLQGCKVPEPTAAAETPAATAPAASTTPEPAAPAAAVAARPALPPEACSKDADGFAAFLEAIAADPALRAAYSAPQVAEHDLRAPSNKVDRPSEPFRLVLIDSRWSYDEPGKDPSDLARVRLELKPDGGWMRADFVKAEFSADDEVIRTFGAPEAYVFSYTQQCWQLAQHLR